MSQIENIKQFMVEHKMENIPVGDTLLLPPHGETTVQTTKTLNVAQAVDVLKLQVGNAKDHMNLVARKAGEVSLENKKRKR